MFLDSDESGDEAQSNATSRRRYNTKKSQMTDKDNVSILLLIIESE